MTLTLIAQSKHRNASRPRTMRESPATVQRQAPIGQHLLQRKEGQFACGGGCPRCQIRLPIRTKLAVSQPGDIHEQDADRVAEAVVSSSAPFALQRKCTCVGDPSCPECEEDKERLIQRQTEPVTDAAVTGLATVDPNKEPD